MVSRIDRIAASLLAQREEVLRRLARPIDEVMAELRATRLAPPAPMPFTVVTLDDELLSLRDELLDLRDDAQELTARLTALASEAHRLTAGADAGA